MTVALLIALAISPPQETSAKVKTPDNSSVGTVSSTGASGGVTAGFVGSVQQTTVLPTLVRGPLLDQFKIRFTEGARLYRMLLDGNLNDDQIVATCNSLDGWYGMTFAWLNKDVSLWAAERFAFKFGGSLSWSLAGDHKLEVVQRRSAYINVVHPLLQNLDQLMREPSLYPDK